MDFLIVLAVLAVVVFVVTAPLRRDRDQADPDAAPPGSEDLPELEAERDAKYREIRDAELDHETGKLSDADFETLDRTLRAEAVEIMHAIDRAGGGPATPEPAADPRSDSE